jgi:hypothetical protein
MAKKQFVPAAGDIVISLYKRGIFKGEFAPKVTRGVSRFGLEAPATQAESGEGTKTKAPPTPFRVKDARRTALPRSLLTTSLRSDLCRGYGSGVPCGMSPSHFGQYLILPTASLRNR